ncbi:MAG TPA: tripartite tricarboxylate transporter substrate binding protein [Pseudolabrys sp.]|nr:tripartite tricarboxylate transporter substrate binding protein [Pseudolabrys sp.]
MTFALRPLLLCLCLLLIGPFGVQSALAQKYPDHPVRVLVGFSAGGPTDVIARLVAQQLSASLGQQFYVDDHPGAGGNIASAEAAKATPDGYTLIVVSTGFMVNMSLYANVPYDAVKDFAPITMVAYSPNVLVVNPSVPAKNVSELIALIKSSPGKYTFAGPGIGSTPHLSGELFKQKFDLDLTHVPFAGAAPAIAATIGGHTPIAFTALPPALANIKDGKLRALAVLALKRSGQISDVPTMREAGYPDQEADTLTGMLAPKGTPQAIVDLLQQEVATAVAKPEVQAQLLKLGFVPVADKPEEFGARIKAEIVKWGKVVHDAHLRIE